MIPTQGAYTALKCLCGREVTGLVTPGPSWDMRAELAKKHGWHPVLAGTAVGASGVVEYACSEAHQDAWLKRL